MQTIQCGRSRAEISLGAILQNFDTLASFLPAETKKMAVVKANAYGHGAVPVAKALENKADYFAVACLEEALELREAGIRTPILILGYTMPAFYPLLAEKDITATLYSVEEAQELSRVALSLGKKARVHIAVDTGMGRIGFTPDRKGAESILQIAALEGIYAEGIFSHYAAADAEKTDSALEQEARFDSVLALLAEGGFTPELRHICNSAGVFRMQKKYDLCRFGISLYGYAPDRAMKLEAELVPAMTVKSLVIHVKTVEAGTPIGYGHSYVAPEKKKIATVGIGYGDGYNRCITGKGYVLIGGKRAKIVGRVCMDQLMVDVSDLPEVRVGMDAVILGKDGEEEITADLLGEWANSFSYEVLCTFLPRVFRKYL